MVPQLPFEVFIEASDSRREHARHGQCDREIERSKPTLPKSSAPVTMEIGSGCFVVKGAGRWSALAGSGVSGAVGDLRVASPLPCWQGVPGISAGHRMPGKDRFFVMAPRNDPESSRTTVAVQSDEQVSEGVGVGGVGGGGGHQGAGEGTGGEERGAEGSGSINGAGDGGGDGDDVLHGFVVEL